MGYFPWTIPDEAVWFVEYQFDRFQAPKPSQKSIDVIGDFVITHVVKNRYWPTTPGDAVVRYNVPGLTEAEKHWFVPQLEIELKIKLRDPITFDQIHLACWSALLFCWSEDAEGAVRWYQINEEREKNAKVHAG